MPHKSTKKDGHSKKVKVGMTTPSSVLPRESEDRRCNTTYTTMLAITSGIGDKGEMRKATKDGLGQALVKEELHIKDKDALCELEITELRKKLLTLTVSSREYKLVRNRFISTFKCDKLNIEASSDTQILQEGNVTAIGGDAVIDATLYKSGVRRDPSTFENLYGLDPLRILKFKSEATIAILNTHAAIVSSQSRSLLNFYELHTMTKVIWMTVDWVV
ncbi:unnamed protein product [Tuber aestivum]|uniref:Uncharacterized protein n=1 Tax=Tuber aestivum TaxID=59557 RepID=A0A292PTF7_9PEZI|nr:unnamed protein product [Tuber aestivum]